MVIRKDSEVETTVYRKSTNNDIYRHWQSFSLITWKQGTLYRHWFHEPSVCAPTTNTWKMKLNTLRKCLETSMAIQIG